MPEEEHGNTIRAPLQSGGKRMKSIEILGKPTDGQKNIADTWTTSTIGISHTAPWHHRHRYESAITLVCKNDDDREAGPRREQEETMNPLRKCSQVFDNNKDDSTTPFRRTRECGKEHSLKNFDQN